MSSFCIDPHTALNTKSRVVSQLGIDSNFVSSTFLANFQEQVNLERDLWILDRDKLTTERRRSADQLLIKRRFEKKLNESQLTKARAAGNRALEAECRNRRHVNKMEAPSLTSAPPPAADGTSAIPKPFQQRASTAANGRRPSHMSNLGAVWTRPTTAPANSKFRRRHSARGYTRNTNANSSDETESDSLLKIFLDANQPKMAADEAVDPVSLKEFNEILMKVQNHDSAVSSFCKKLESDTNGRKMGTADYYMQRMKEMSGGRKLTDVAEEKNEDKEEEEPRSEFNSVNTQKTKLRNMTFKNIREPLFVYTHK